MKQLTLDFGLAPEPTFTDYIQSTNVQALEQVRAHIFANASESVPIYLWGVRGSGKSHILRAARTALLEQGIGVGWLDAKTPRGSPFHQTWGAVLLDDIDAYNQRLQHTAFSWFINALSPLDGNPRIIIAAGSLPPTDLKLREDLRTRLGWGHIFELKSLNEEDARIVLQNAAKARGVDLSNEVLKFMLERFARDMTSLMQLFEELDQYALENKRQITVPLIKMMLQEGENDTPK